MICARCQQPFEPHASVRYANVIMICEHCGETLVLVADGTTRKAMGADTERLPPEALKALRSARTSLRKSRRGDTA